MKKGVIQHIKGLDNVENDSRIVANVQRLYVGDEVLKEWIGTEKQVMTRLYLVCDSKQELASALWEYMNSVEVLDSDGNNMVLNGFNVKEALELE